jgi:uncharacterized protein
VIAVDANILVYAHRGDSPWHARAALSVRELAEGTAAWAIPWACLHEFFAIVTHPRIYKPPTPVDQAIAQVDAWLESPTLVLLGEAESHWRVLRELLLAGKVSGPPVHDARIAAVCVTHGVRTLWTADRDFSRFPALHTVNPLIAG